MPRYVAFLRGVMPTNAKMPELRRAFEGAGFTNVKTVLGSGNVVFDAKAASESALERKAEAAMTAHLGRSFYTIVRSVDGLEALIDADPFAPFAPLPRAKRVVSFLRAPHSPTLALPPESEGVCIGATTGREIFTAYLPHPRGPVFMTMIAKLLRSDVTTRTWETVKRCVCA
jgi:uncharacterized protein (DUF1697 family)